MNPTSKKPTTLIAMRHGGTHLIQPIIRHLTGRSVYAPKGDASLTCVPGPKLVVFLRDPRNRMVSHFRFKNPRSPAEHADVELAALITDRKRGQTPVGFMVNWARRWVGAGGLEVLFEDLVARPQEAVERIRDYLDAPGSASAAVEYAFGTSGTWTGRHSHWPEWFGPESRRAWTAQGGDELVHLMGYGHD